MKELRGKSVAPKEIAETLGISLDLVRWLYRHPPSREEYRPDLSPRPELAYLVGAYLGDGRTAGQQDKKVRFKVADAEFAKQLNELVAGVLGRAPKLVSMERGFFCVNYDAAELYDFLQRPFEAFEALEDAFPNMFLRGFFEAEGYASPKLNHTEQQFVGITIGVANTSMAYLARAKELLSSFGIESKFHTTHQAGEEMAIRGRRFVRKNAVRHLVITRQKDVCRFHSTVGFAVPKKREKLSDMVGILKEMSPADAYRWFLENYQKRNRRWTRNVGTQESFN